MCDHQSKWSLLFNVLLKCSLVGLWICAVISGEWLQLATVNDWRDSKRLKKKKRGSLCSFLFSC